MKYDIALDNAWNHLLAWVLMEFREALTGARVEAKNRAITIDVPALFGRVLISR